MILQKTEKLFSDWNANSIRYCSFKSNEHLMEGLCGDTDLDILVNIDDYSRATELMQANHYIQVEPINVGAYPNVVNWYGMDETTGLLIHIHLHFELMTGKPLYKDYCLPWANLFIETAFLDEESGLYCADPNMEYVLLCTRLVVKRLKAPKKNNIPIDIIKELDYLNEKLNEEKLRFALEQMYGTYDYYYETMLNVQNLSDSEFIEYYHRVKKAMRNYQRTRETTAFINSYKNRINRKFSRVANRHLNTELPLKKRFTKGGISVSFVGVDGSGKSTVSTIIYKWLDAEFDTVRFYAGAGDGKKDMLSSILLKGYKAIKKDEGPQGSVMSSPDDFSKRTLTFKQKIKGLGSSIAYNRILKSNINNLKKSEKLVKSGVVCIMDRYPQNSIPYVHDGAKVRKYDTGKGILHLCAKKEEAMLLSIKEYPYSVLFRLIVSPEVSYDRKPEESIQSLKYKVETLQRVKFDVNKVVDVDASKPLEEVVLKVKTEIWNTLALK